MRALLRAARCCIFAVAIQGGMLSAQVVQYGRVIEMNSGKKGLAGVSVVVPSAHDCQPTVTDANGLFRLSFGEHKVGDVVMGLNARKNGYEMVNTHITREGCTLTDRDSLRVVMAPAGQIKEAKMRYYYLLEEASISRYDTTMAFLNQQYAQKQLSGPQWNYWKGLAEQELKEAYLNMEDYADKLARINGDDLNVEHYRLYEQLISGHVMPALALVAENDDMGVMDTYIAFAGNYPMETPAVQVAGTTYDLVDIPDSLYNDAMALDNYSQQYEADFNANGVNYAKCCRYLGKLFMDVDEKVMAATCYRKALKMYELLHELDAGDFSQQITELKSQLESLE